MQCVTSRSYCQIDDVVGIQVAQNRVGANVVCGIGLLDVEPVAVGVGIDGYRLDAHLLACPNNSNSNFAPVCDENFLDHA